MNKGYDSVKELLDKWVEDKRKLSSDKSSLSSTNSKLVCVNGLPYMSFVQVVGDDRSPRMILPLSEVISDTSYSRFKLIKNASINIPNYQNTKTSLGYGFVSKIDPLYCNVKVAGNKYDSSKYIPAAMVDKYQAVNPDNIKSPLMQLIRNPNFRLLESCIRETYNNSFMHMIEDFWDATGWLCEEIPEVNAYNFTTLKYRELMREHALTSHTNFVNTRDYRYFTMHLFHINVELGHYYATNKYSINYNKNDPNDVNCFTEYVPIMYTFSNIVNPLTNPNDLGELFLKMFPSTSLPFSPDCSFIIKQPIYRNVYNATLPTEISNLTTSYFITRNDVRLLMKSNSLGWDDCNILSPDDVSNNSAISILYNGCDCYDYREFSTRMVSLFLQSNGLSFYDYTEEMRYTILSGGVIIGDNTFNNYYAIKALCKDDYNDLESALTLTPYKRTYSRNYIIDDKSSKNNIKSAVKREFEEVYFENEDGVQYYSILPDKEEECAITEYCSNNASADNSEENDDNDTKNEPIVFSTLNKYKLYNRKSFRINKAIIVNCEFDNSETDRVFLDSNLKLTPLISKDRMLDAKKFAVLCRKYRIFKNDFLSNEGGRGNIVNSVDKCDITYSALDELEENWNNWLNSLKGVKSNEVSK